jgi:hypothetical protein
MNYLLWNVHGELCCVGPVEGTDSLLSEES